jgi:hypothetical protein
MAEEDTVPLPLSVRRHPAVRAIHIPDERKTGCNPNKTALWAASQEG